MVEYKIFKKPLDSMPTPEEQEKYLNELGKEGWKCFKIAIQGSFEGDRLLFYCWRRGDKCTCSHSDKDD